MFCLQLGSRSYIGIKEFEQINWLPVSERFNQCICLNAFNFFNENCPLSVFIYDLCKSSGKDEINIRSSVLKLKHLSRSTCSGQNTSYLTPTFWNNLPICLKLSNNFKHGVKEHFFKTLKDKEQDVSFLLIKVTCCINIYFKLLFDIRKCFCE